MADDLTQVAQAGDGKIAADYAAARASAGSLNAEKDLDSLLTPQAPKPAGGTTEGAAAATAATEAAAQAQQSLPPGQRILNGIKAVTGDIARGAVGLPREVAGGGLDYLNGLFKFADDVVRKGEEHGLPNAYFRLFDQSGNWSPSVMSTDEFRAAQQSGQDGLFQLPTPGKPDSVTGNIVRGGTQFLLGRGKLASGGGVVRNAIADFVSGATAFDPGDKRLSNWVQEHAPNMVTEWLQAKPGDEHTFLGRVKTGLEYSGLGFIAEKVIGGLKQVKNAILGGGGEGAAPEAVAAAPGAPSVALRDTSAPAAPAPKVAPVPTAAEPAPQMAAGGTPPKPPVDTGVPAPKEPQQPFLPIGDVKKPAVEIPPDLEARAHEYFTGKIPDELPVSINLERIGSPADIKDVIAQVSRQIGKTAPISHDATVAAADALGVKPEQLMAQYGQPEAIGNRIAGIRAELAAGRMVMDSSAAQLKKYAQEALDATTGTDEARAKALKAYAAHVAIQDTVMGGMSEAGRLLNSLKIMSARRANYGNAVRSIIESAGGDEPTTDILKKIADLETPTQVNRLVAASRMPTSRDNFLKVFYNVLLSNPRTCVKKLASDSVMATWNLATRYAAEKFGSNVPAGETAQLATGYMNSFRDAIRFGAKALRTGESQFHVVEDSADMARWHKLATGSPDVMAIDTPTKSAMDYIRSAMPTSWIGSVSDFAGYWNYRAELHALAYRDAVQKGLDGSAFDTHVAQVLDNVPPEMHEQAFAAAQRNTFLEPLSGLDKKLQQTVDAINLPIAHTDYEIPMGRVLMPFVKVPMNIAKWSYRNTVAALAFPSSVIKQELSAGGATRDLALAKIGLGSGVSMALVPWVLGGQITGRGPKDPQLQRAWRDAGNEPYSIRVGKKWYSYNSVEPFGLLMGAIADTHTIMKFAHDDGRQNLAASLAFGVGNALMSKTYLQGVGDFFDALNDPERSGKHLAQNIVASMVVPQGVSAMERATDDFVRAHYDMVDDIESKLPMVAQKLPPMRTLWGDAVPVKDGFLPGLTGTGVAKLLSPIGVRSTEAQPIDKWIWENRAEFPQAPDNKLGISKPGIVQRFSGGKGVSVELMLSPQQFDRFQVLAGNELKDPSSGLGARDYLNALVNGQHPSASVQGQWDKATPGAKALIVQDVINKFRSAAKYQLMQDYPDIEDAVRSGFETRAGQLTAQ